MTNPIIKYWVNGNIHSKVYKTNDLFHRDPLDGPTLIHYDVNGNVKLEEYRVNGLLHRDPLEGPAHIRYNGDGKIISKIYFVNGNSNNPYGPAFNNYKYNQFTWSINGEIYTNEVNEYLDKHGFDWQDMDQTDFDIMWACIL